METIQFNAKIKNGVIEIPKKYHGKIKDNVHVILVVEGEKSKAQGYLDALISRPLKVNSFRPLTREEAHGRN